MLMFWLLCAEGLIGMLLVAAMIRTRGCRRLYLSEELAHSEALDRQGYGTRERGICATVLALGEDATERPCRVVSVSQSKIHLVSTRSAKAGDQLQVQRGDEYFVGDVRDVNSREDGYFLEIGVFSSNYRPTGPIAWVKRTIGCGIAFVMRQFAIKVLRAQWRPHQDRRLG